MQLPAFMTGAPGRNRTCGLQLRRLSLYPTELRARRPTCRGSFYACQEQGCWRPGQTHLISAFADLLFDGIIRQNQPFWRWRRHLGLFAAHVLEYSPALDARKARPARQRARPFGPPSGRFPRKKCHFPCRHAKILFFRILPAPAIRLRFAPAEQRWLRLFFVRSPIYRGIKTF